MTKPPVRRARRLPASIPMGLRQTRQRQALEEMLSHLPRPMTAHEIHMEMRQQLPTLGIATVYRTLASMEMAGMVRQVQLPKDAPRYEPATLPPHYYFRCTGCTRVFWAFGRMPEILAMTPRGFVSESHQIYLYGRCAPCSAT